MVHSAEVDDQPEVRRPNGRCRISSKIVRAATTVSLDSSSTSLPGLDIRRVNATNEFTYFAAGAGFACFFLTAPAE